MKNRTIRVQGKGAVSQAPDRVQIHFTISETQEGFADAVEGCNTRIDAVRHAVSSAGLPASELKTTSFNIREAHEYRSGTNIHVGFEAIHGTVIEIPLDKPLIGRLLTDVIRGKARPQVNLNFSVSDPEGLRQRVLADAVANAKRRAETIAQAGSLKLGSIENIEYGYSEIRISSEPCDLALELASEPEPNVAPDFDPHDVDAVDTVTITWAINDA